VDTAALAGPDAIRRGPGGLGVGFAELEPACAPWRMLARTDEEALMAGPALYWNARTATLAKSDILSAAKKIMQDKGMTNIKVSTNTTGGHTATTHASIGAVKKHDPPSPGPGLGTTTPPTYIVVFVAAGSDAKSVRDGLMAAWDDLTFL
jgi:hypothetical protein